MAQPQEAAAIGGLAGGIGESASQGRGAVESSASSKAKGIDEDTCKVAAAAALASHQNRNAASRVQTPPPRPRRDTADAPARPDPKVETTTKASLGERLVAVAKPRGGIMYLLAGCLVMCILDSARLISHPTRHIDVPVANPCHSEGFNATPAVIEALLKRRVSERQKDLDQYMKTKTEAIKKEDFLLAKNIKVDEAKFQAAVQEASNALSIYKNVTDTYNEVFCLVPSETSPFKQGLPSGEVREWYTQQLESIVHRLQSCKRMPETIAHNTPCGLAAVAVSMRLPSWAVREWYTQPLEVVAHRLHAYRLMYGLPSDLEATSAPCTFAALAVRIRSKIKGDARLYGSVVMHVGCIVRDWYYYGFFPDVIQRKRASMLQKGLSPADVEVCNAILDSSFRASEAVTSVGKELKAVGMSFVVETVCIYLGLGLTIWVIGCLSNLFRLF